MIDQPEADILKRLEESPDSGVRAFECSNCQVVVFEDELIEGRFVPSEFTQLLTHPNAGLARTYRARFQVVVGRLCSS